MPSGVYKRSSFHRNKIAKAMKGNENALGHVVSDEAKDRIGKAVSLALRGRELPEEVKQKIAQALKGRKITWGSKIGKALSKVLLKDWNKLSYIGKHKRIYRLYGKPTKCEGENCTKKYKSYQWANISGKYKLSRKDWKELCTSCHTIFDHKRYKNEKE